MIADVIDAQTQPNADGGPDAPGRAFADVATEQLDGLYGYCIRLANDRIEAEDLVQDTLLRAMRAYPGLRDETKVKSWLFTIATNAWRDVGRARGRTLATVGIQDRTPFDFLTASSVSAKSNADLLEFSVQDAGPFYHGTKVDLATGDPVAPGYSSNFGEQKTANFVYLAGTAILLN